VSGRSLSDSRVRWFAFVLSFACYVSVGYWLQVRHGFIIGDSLARVEAAQSVLFSRSPHVAAIGFIFTPLTAALQIPLVALGNIWPPMAERAFSGTLMSATFMAGAVVQILGIGMDRGLARWFVLTVAALFALNPMIVFYGSNGMSEAPFIFFIVWATRRLIMWMVDDDVHHLIAAGGVAMGLAYLTRYDAVAVIAVAGFLVVGTTYLRARKSPRFKRALLDMILVSGPGTLAFVGWAVASWLITGLAFAQFSSQYGNSSILAQEGAGSAPPKLEALLYSLTSITLLSVTLGPLLIWAVVARWGRTYWTMLVAPVTLFGAVLGFQAYTFSKGATFPFLRFYIAAIPFAATIAFFCVRNGRLRTPVRLGNYAVREADPSLAAGKKRTWAYVLSALLLAASLPVAGWGMTSAKYAPQEYGMGALFAGPNASGQRNLDQRRLAATFSTERDIARYLDRIDLPDGSILADPVYAFAIIVASRHPKRFVVPSDPDFVAMLNDPTANRVRYMLAVPNKGRGAADALNQRYPALYETGSDVATLELEVPNAGKDQPVWRLYRVNDPVSITG